MAASSHNTQPWRFSINPETNTVNCYIDKTTVLPASDKNGRQTIISLGCSLANMEIGARYFGYKTEITIIENDQKKVLPIMQEDEVKIINIANIIFTPTPSEQAEESLYQAMFKRKAIRTEYNLDEKLPESFIKDLEQICDNTGTKLHSITDPVRRMSIAEFQGQADGFVINSKKFSKELGDWLLPNDTESFVGMPGSGFGLDQEQSIRLHEALLGKRPLEPEDGLRFSAGGKIGFEKSPYIGFITGEKDDIKHWLETGKAFEKIFLNLTAQGYALAVHAGVVEVALINKMFAMTLGTTKKILMLFRAGKIKKEEDNNRPHSPRLLIEDIIIKNL